MEKEGVLGNDNVKSKSFYSVLSLLSTSAYSAVLGFFAFFILTIRSGAHLLGIYNTVLASLAVFNYLTNLGLAAAVMQKKDIEKEDLDTAFIIQNTLAAFAVIFGIVATPYIFRIYPDLPSSAKYLYWAVLFSFMMASLRTIPSVLMEKKIEIYKVVSAQALENTVFYVVIIVLVYFNFTISALVAAVIARSIVGFFTIYFLNPWLPSLNFSFSSAKQLLSYGIPYQMNSIIALLKDDLLILWLGSVIGMKALGYVMFAKKYAEFILRIVMDNINRVAFPLFALYQKNKHMLKNTLNSVFLYESFIIFPAICGALFVFEDLLKVYPGYFEKWSIALPSFYFFCGSSLLVSLYSPLVSFLNAIGKVKVSLYIMVLLTLLTWILVPIFIYIFGWIGISMAFFCMSFVFVFVFKIVKKHIDFSVIESLKKNIIATLFLGFFLLIVKYVESFVQINRLVYIFIVIIASSIVYLLIQYKLQKSVLLQLISLTKLNFFVSKKLDN